MNRMLRRWCIWGSLSLTTVAAAAAQDAAKSPNRNVSWPDDDAIRAKLGTTRISAIYEEMTFEDVIADLRRRTGLNISVRWNALEVAAIERDQFITEHLSDVPISTVLRTTLDQVGGTDISLEFEVIDGVIEISTGEDMCRRTVDRVYYVGDLVRTPHGMWRATKTPALRLQRVGGDGASTVGLRTPASTGSPNPADESESAAGPLKYENLGSCGSTFWEASDRPWSSAFPDAESLLELVKRTVDPESWRDAGGNLGSISLVGQSLVVTQSYRAQRELRKLLKTLRESVPDLLTVDALLVRFPAPQAHKWRKDIGPAFPFLDDKQFDSLAGGDDQPPAHVLFSGTSTGYGGERLWFSELVQREILAGAVPIVGQSIVGFQPITTPVEEGLELIVSPVLSEAGTDVILDVQMAWAPPADIRRRDVGSLETHGDAPATTADATASLASTPLGASADKTATIDLATRRMRTVVTRVRVPIGRAIALSVAAPIHEDETVRYQDWLILKGWRPLSRK